MMEIISIWEKVFPFTPLFAIYFSIKCAALLCCCRRISYVWKTWATFVHTNRFLHVRFRYSHNFKKSVFALYAPDKSILFTVFFLSQWKSWVSCVWSMVLGDVIIALHSSTLKNGETEKFHTILSSHCQIKQEMMLRKSTNNVLLSIAASSSISWTEMAFKIRTIQMVVEVILFFWKNKLITDNLCFYNKIKRECTV